MSLQYGARACDVVTEARLRAQRGGGAQYDGMAANLLLGALLGVTLVWRRQPRMKPSCPISTILQRSPRMFAKHRAVHQYAIF